MTNDAVRNKALFGPVDGFGGGILHGRFLCFVVELMCDKTYTIMS